MRGVLIDPLRAPDVKSISTGQLLAQKYECRRSSECRCRGGRCCAHLLGHLFKCGVAASLQTQGSLGSIKPGDIPGSRSRQQQKRALIAAQGLQHRSSSKCKAVWGIGQHISVPGTFGIASCNPQFEQLLGGEAAPIVWWRKN